MYRSQSTIFLGNDTNGNACAGAKRRLIAKKDFAYYAPILKTLEVLLNNQCFADEVCCFKSSHVAIFVGKERTQVIYNMMQD